MVEVAEQSSSAAPLAEPVADDGHLGATASAEVEPLGVAHPSPRVYVHLRGYWCTPEQAKDAVADGSGIADGTSARAGRPTGAGEGQCSFPGCIFRERHGGPHGFGEDMLLQPTPKRKACAPCKWEPPERNGTGVPRAKPPPPPPASAAAAAATSPRPNATKALPSSFRGGLAATPVSLAEAGGHGGGAGGAASAGAAPSAVALSSPLHRLPRRAEAAAAGRGAPSRHCRLAARLHATASTSAGSAVPSRGRALAAAAPLRYNRVHLQLNGWWATPETLRIYRCWALEGLCNFPGCPLPDRHCGPHLWDQETADQQWFGAPPDKRA